VLSPIAQTTPGESTNAIGTTANLLGEHGGSAFFPNTTAPRTTQSPSTHALQQAARNDALHYVQAFHSGAPFSSIEDPLQVDTVNSDGNSLNKGIGPTDLISALSNASDPVGTVNDPIIGSYAVNTNTANDLVDDPNQAGHVVTCGPLGSQSGTPVLGSNDEGGAPFFGSDSLGDVVVVGQEEPLDSNVSTVNVPPSTTTRI